MPPSPIRIASTVFQKVQDNPHSALTIARLQAFKRTHGPFYKRSLERTYGPPITVPEEDWDTLIILDACRYDYFKQQNSIDGRLEPVLSHGSQSWEFLQENFVGRDLSDTVYVTSNPFADRLTDDIFYAVEPVFHEHYGPPGTVRPEAVVNAALEAHEQHPNKRLIVHFMQPHNPYLGPTGDRFREQFDLWGWNKHHGNDDAEDNPTGPGVWELVRSGEVPAEDLRQAYRENLSLALTHTQQLLEQLNGRAVVTADHGELLGERSVGPELGHPAGYHLPELRVVPWLTVEGDERREVISEEPRGFERLAESEMNERLRGFGYLE